MFHVGQRVVCDRNGINSRWRLEDGRIEERTHFDLEQECLHGFPQRGGVYTISKVGPKHIMLAEIPCVYLDDTEEAVWWDQDLFRPLDNSGRDLKWVEFLESIRELACSCGFARRCDGKLFAYYSWKKADLYSAAFKQFMYSPSGYGGVSTEWEALGIFDAVNVVMSEANYNNCTIPDDGHWPPDDDDDSGPRRPRSPRPRPRHGVDRTRDRVAQLLQDALTPAPAVEDA